MRIDLRQVEKALEELEQVESGQANRFVVARERVNRKIKGDLVRWLTAGMAVPVGDYPLISAVQHQINDGSDKCLLRRRACKK